VAPRVWRLATVRTDIDLGPLRWAGGAMLALGAILPHMAGNPGLPCPLRSTTGVPCPFCGLTTSVKAALGGKMHAAAVANPFGILAVLIAIILLVRPAWRRVQVPATLLVASVGVSWLFELHRFHFI
jgi:Protein of unknown function (DUF2752)